MVHIGSFRLNWRAMLIGFSELHMWMSFVFGLSRLSSERAITFVVRIRLWINSKEKKEIEITERCVCVPAFLFHFHLESMMHRESRTKIDEISSHTLATTKESQYPVGSRRQFNQPLTMLAQQYLHWKLLQYKWRTQQQDTKAEAKKNLYARHARRLFYENAPCAGYVLSAYTQITLR